MKLILFALVLLLTASCTKDNGITYHRPAKPELREYSLVSPTGGTAGVFTIGNNREGESMVTIELDKKSHIYGTRYQAVICPATATDCFVKLEDVNAVIGYSETRPVKDSAGRQLQSAELFAKTGYRVVVRDAAGEVATGIIR